MDCIRPFYNIQAEQHVSCGQCMNCRLRHARDWTNRLIIEGADHPGQTWFLTMTYSPEHFPSNGSLNVEDMQGFNKRLRHHSGKFRMLYVGEYGENPEHKTINPKTGEPRLGRAHYHGIYFGIDIPDWEGKIEPNGDTQYSEYISDIWGKGNCKVAPASQQTMAYCCRYTIKKQRGKKAAVHYETMHPETGEVHQNLKPEFMVSSRNPGIGFPRFLRHPDDAIKGFVTVDGKKIPVPGAVRKKLNKTAYTEIRAKVPLEGTEKELQDAELKLQRAKKANEHPNIIETLTQDRDNLKDLVEYRIQQRYNSRKRSVSKPKTL